MSDVCYDWSVVGYTSHPIPGDAEQATSAGNEFRRTKQHLETAASSLRRLDGADTVSEAVDELRGNARDIARLLDAAMDRYDVASRALLTYAPELAKAKHQAEQAVQAAGSAQREHQQAAQNAHNLWWAAKTNIDPQERQQFLTTYYQANAQAEQAEANVADARAKVEAAISHRDSAARAAQASINPAISNKDLNDDLIDHLRQVWEALEGFGTWVLDNYPGLKMTLDALGAIAQFVWEHIDEIALGLTIAAFVLGWVPGLGQVVAVLAIAARIASAISWAKKGVALGQGIAKGHSTGNWQDAIDAGTAIGLTLVSKWAGGKVAPKILGQASKSSFDRLAKVSVAQTGSYRTATNAVLQRVSSPTYHPGHNPAATTEIAQRTDSLIGTFKGTDFTSAVRQLNHNVQFAESGQANDLLEDVIEGTAGALGKELESLGNRQATQKCEPVLAGTNR